MHPIIRQIIDRDCHVSESDKDVVRHVISRLKNGYETYRSLSQSEREHFVTQCVEHHRSNKAQYIGVMSGFTRTLARAKSRKCHSDKLVGKEIVNLMRKHKVTIRNLAAILGTTMKRVRHARTTGLDGGLVVRDWLQAITGEDVGPIPNRLVISQDLVECAFCGIPILCHNLAYEYVGEVFCTRTCFGFSRSE